MDILEGLSRWFGFQILLPLVPVAFNGYRARDRGVERWFTEAIGRGELLLIGAMLCALAVENVIEVSGQYLPARFALAATSIIILMVNALFFADCTAAYRRPRLVGTPALRRISLGCYLASVILSGLAVLLNKVM